MRWNISVYNSTRASIGMVTDCNGCHQRGITPDESTITDDSAMLLLSIVIRGNHTSSNVDMFSNGGISNIAEMVHIAIRSNIRVFDLAKITHTHVLAQVCSGTAVTKGSHRNPVVQLCLLKY